MTPAFVLAEAAALVLATARIAGFVLVSPFPGKGVPGKIKIGLVLVLAFLVRAAVPATPALGLDLGLLGVIPGELGIGLVIGLTVRVTFAAAEILGAAFAQSTGLMMGQVYDPTAGADETVPARVVTLFAMLLFLALGAHRVALAYVLESFRALPLGAGAELAEAAPSFVALVAQAMDGGVRLGLPVMAIGLVVQIALALVARASPSLQVFSVGLGITVVAGLLSIIDGFDDAAAGLAAELSRAGPNIERVLDAIQPVR